MIIELKRNNFLSDMEMDAKIFAYFFENRIAFSVICDTIDMTTFEVDDENADKVKKHLAFLKLIYK
jgi:hypothetical protein